KTTILQSFPTRRSSDLDKNDLKFIDKRLLELVNEFNLINSDSRNKIYVQDAQNKSKQLTAIWNEINALMDDANKKLSKMGSFSGDRKSTRLNSSHVSIS